MTKPHNARKEAAMHDIEELQQRALAAIDEIKFCAEQLAKLMGMTTAHDEASGALDNIIVRVDDLPMDIENIRDESLC